MCDCDSPDVGAGNQIQFLYKSHTKFLTAEPLQLGFKRVLDLFPTVLT